MDGMVDKMKDKVKKEDSRIVDTGKEDIDDTKDTKDTKDVKDVKDVKQDVRPEKSEKVEKPDKVKTTSSTASTPVDLSEVVVEKIRREKVIVRNVYADIYTVNNLHIKGYVMFETTYDHLRLPELFALADRCKTGFIVVQNAEVYRSGAVETLVARYQFLAVSVSIVTMMSARAVSKEELVKLKVKAGKK